MAINIQKYVDITSGVGGAVAAVARELIGRLFTANPLVPTNSLIEFTSPDEVGLYFGTSSQEYFRAVFYFGFISKSITKAKKISFARYIDSDVSPLIFGTQNTLNTNLAGWQAITDGSFELTMASETIEITGLDFNAVASFADVATVIETAIQAASVDPFWAGATVTYNAVTGGFDLVGGATGVAVISGAPGTAGTNIFTIMGWISAIYSDGALQETPVDSVSASDDASDNFGSFAFIPVLTLPQIQAIGAWNHAENVKYQYCVPVQETDAQTYYDALNTYSGLGLTILNVSFTNEYPEMMEMIILAATDYTRRNSVQNYMFQMFSGITATVTETSVSNSLDAIRVNYYGQTQQAGKNISFYQRGLLMGLATAPIAMNVFANEQWLKDAARVDMLNLLLTNARIPANRSGEDQVRNKLQQSTITAALFNSVISVGKELTVDQKDFITTNTGDELAWHQVQDIGYWLDVTIEPIPSSNPTEYQANYTLIYAKDDAINKVVGTHALI